MTVLHQAIEILTAKIMNSRLLIYIKCLPCTMMIKSCFINSRHWVAIIGIQIPASFWRLKAKIMQNNTKLLQNGTRVYQNRYNIGNFKVLGTRCNFTASQRGSLFNKIQTTANAESDSIQLLINFLRAKSD